MVVLNQAIMEDTERGVRRRDWAMMCV